MEKRKFLKNLLSILSIVVFIFIAFGSSDSDSDSSSSEDLLAYNYAETYVKQRLKSPSTAEFAGLFEKRDHITKVGDREYKITSYVDSQNGFGATLRSKWSCTIKFVGNNVQCNGLVVY
jgi:hypothetical protein